MNIPIQQAMKTGCARDEILNPTKTDRWFLVQPAEIVDLEEKLAVAKN